MNQPQEELDWFAAPATEQAIVRLPATPRFRLPESLYLTGGPHEAYPKGSLTVAVLVSNVADMNPGNLYIIRLTDHSYVIQPFVEVADECIQVGAWNDEASPPPPVLLAEIADVFLVVQRLMFNQAAQQWQSTVDEKA